MFSDKRFSFALSAICHTDEAYLSDTRTYTEDRPAYVVIVLPHIKYVAHITYLAFVILRAVPQTPFNYVLTDVLNTSNVAPSIYIFSIFLSIKLKFHRDFDTIQTALLSHS